MEFLQMAEIENVYFKFILSVRYDGGTSLAIDLAKISGFTNSL